MSLCAVAVYMMCGSNDKELAMGKVVSNFFISLDGVVESPDKWQFPYFNEGMARGQ
jgi:hypothetical protein